MNSLESAKFFLSDANIILQETTASYKKKHWHRVVRKCQEACELAVKALFRYLALEYPKSHLLGRVIKKELKDKKILTKSELDKIAYISDELAFNREPAFYGSPEGIPPSELFDQEDAKELLEKTTWVLNVISKIILDRQ